MIMKATINSIKKVVCVAAVISTLGISVFAASPKTTSAKQTTAIEQQVKKVLPYRGKIKTTKKDGVTYLQFVTIDNKKLNVVVEDPLLKEDLLDIKGVKVFLTGYIDEEAGIFYVSKIGRIPLDTNLNAK